MTARVTQLSSVIYIGIDVGANLHSITIANDKGEFLRDRGQVMNLTLSNK